MGERVDNCSYNCELSLWLLRLKVLCTLCCWIVFVNLHWCCVDLLAGCVHGSCYFAS